MTPSYDWTRFDKLRESTRVGPARLSLAHVLLRGKLADARELLERGQAVRMFPPYRGQTKTEAYTPNDFCDLWEQGYRP
jgi:hypothetical protein